MNKEKFLNYFKKNGKKTEQGEEIVVTKIVSAATKEVTNAELRFVADEVEKSHARPKQYQKDIPEKLKKEIGHHALTYGTASAVKKYSKKFPKYKIIRTSVNNWKKKCNTGEDVVFKKPGRPNLLNQSLIKKVKDIAIGTRQAGGVINRRQILNIAKGVVKSNNPEILVEFGGTVELTNRWARSILSDMNWCKRKGTTGKVEPSPQFLAEEKFTFQRAISSKISMHDIPSYLVLNIDQTPLSYVSPGKYSFSFKGSKHVPIKGVDDKRQITATFAVSSTGEFLPMQLIYGGKTKRSLPRYEFPVSFSVGFTANHWSNTDKSLEFFDEIIFPYLEKKKEENGLPNEQHSLVIMDTFKGQDNDILKEFCSKNRCELVIVPHNLTNKFQPLDLSVNKAAKAFVQNQYNDWFSDQVARQLKKGIAPADIKISSKLSDLKPRHAGWIVNLFNHMQEEAELIEKGFSEAGISEAINNAQSVYERVENPFRE